MLLMIMDREHWEHLKGLFRDEEVIDVKTGYKGIVNHE